MPYSINLNIDLSPLPSTSQSQKSPITLSNLSSLNLFSIFRMSQSPAQPSVSEACRTLSLTFSLSQSESHYTNTHVYVFPLTLSLLINNNHLSKEEEKRGRTKELNSWRTSKEIQTHLDWLFPLPQRLLVGIPGELCLGLENNQMLHKVQVEQPLARLFFLSVSVDSNIRYVSVKVKEKMQMCKQRHRTAWGTGIKPKMDA